MNEQIKDQEYDIAATTINHYLQRRFMSTIKIIEHKLQFIQIYLSTHHLYTLNRSNQKRF